MSRYFKYKTSQALLADAHKLGLDLRLSDDLSSLFRPIDVGGRRVGNRLAIQPMEGCDAELDGSPGELTFRRFRRFGAGGAKLIWGEACAVVPEGRANPRQLVINAANAPALERLLATTRRPIASSIGRDDDLLVGLQLTHSGRYSCERPILAQHDPLLDPRTIVDKATGATAGTGHAADLRRRARPAAGPLRRRPPSSRIRSASTSSTSSSATATCLNELLAARTRPGKYGGSFENRTRFIREVVGTDPRRLPRTWCSPRA